VNGLRIVNPISADSALINSDAIPMPPSALPSAPEFSVSIVVALSRRHVMTEKAEEDSRGWPLEIVWVAIYSIALLMFVLSWE
jgi:hypothetical protein